VKESLLTNISFWKFTVRKYIILEGYVEGIKSLIEDDILYYLPDDSTLREPALILHTESVQRLARRMERFVKKQGTAINTLVEMAVKTGTPKTTNSLESKNALFKPFSRIAKSFYLATAQNFFAGVVLMENFDVKSRGLHQGTVAIQRAEVNLDDLGASDFFYAVGLDLPQISHRIFTE
jgi:hypothetical protein